MQVYKKDSPEEKTSGYDEILTAALSLTPEARAQFADQLLASLDGEDQKEIDAAWVKKLREESRKSGKEKSKP